MTTKLHASMAKAFAAIEGATKDTNNPFFKTKYADLSSVVAAIKPALVANDLFFTQASHERDGGVCVETFVHHADGGSMSFGSLFVPASKNDAQAYGSAMTYARRYSLQTAFGVCPEDDDGNAAVTHSKAQTAMKAPAKPVMEPPCSDVDVTRITELAEAAGVSLDVIKESYLVDDIAKLNATQAMKTINNLKKRIDDNGAAK